MTIYVLIISVKNISAWHCTCTTKTVMWNTHGSLTLQNEWHTVSYQAHYLQCY